MKLLQYSTCKQYKILIIVFVLNPLDLSHFLGKAPGSSEK